MLGPNFVRSVCEVKEIKIRCRVPDTPVLWPVFTSMTHIMGQTGYSALNEKDRGKPPNSNSFSSRENIALFEKVKLA